MIKNVYCLENIKKTFNTYYPISNKKILKEDSQLLLYNTNNAMFRDK